MLVGDTFYFYFCCRKIGINKLKAKAMKKSLYLEQYIYC